MNNVIVRAPTLDDAHRVSELIAERDRADFAEVDSISFTGDELREWWRLDEALLETDAWIALAGGDVVAYARARDERDLAYLEDDSCVHPKARGSGLGSKLLDLAESWARDRDLARMQVHVVTEDGRRLAEERGHELVRYHWRMEIDLGGEPPELAQPEGLTIRDYRPGDDDEALHAAHQEAYAGHWEFTPEALEEWLKWRGERGDYNAELWRLATDGEEVAGAALCFGERHQGWVLDLFVGRGWRRRSCVAPVRIPRALAAWSYPRRPRGRLGERVRCDASLRAGRYADHPPLRDLRESTLRPDTLSDPGP
jgi:GNAT superfamily N-acetyltransferase